MLKIFFFFIISIICLSVEEVYVDDPKKEIDSRWESIHFIVHENQDWRRTMESDRKGLRS
jgi:hypothetical protein